jgi:hypothetical protein
MLACSPGHNWREVRPAGGQIQVLMPCKATFARRDVVLAGTSTPMRLAACTAAGHTWAVTELDLGPKQSAATMLRALREAAAANILATAAPDRQAGVDWPPPGATAAPESGAWQLTGKRPDGSGVTMQLALSARGRSVVQLSVIGSTAAEPETLDVFLASLRWLPV